jgi:proton-translocating NAD(P)+ transhydrogenase subunit alpha
MIIAIIKEQSPEYRVAMVPSLSAALIKAGHQVIVETGAGVAAGYPDDEYVGTGARMEPDRDRLFENAEVLLMVRGPGISSGYGPEDLSRLRSNHILIAFFDPLMYPRTIQELADTGVTAFSLELIPRISRAQSMDALSSMATLAGYKSVLIAANALPKIFPLMMTAAGSLMPARVFVMGAGVAGLQACATAKRLGAIVSAYDIRPGVKDEVKSVGAEFVEFELSVDEAEDSGGYAKSQSDEFYRRQQEAMTKVMADHDVIIATAGVPGKKAPVLITEKMVNHMAPGSVIVDLVAELGGNCALTRPGQTIYHNGVTIIGPVNLASSVPYHASQMLAKNVTAFLTHLTDPKGHMVIDMKEVITLNTLLCKDGRIANQRVMEALGEWTTSS